MADNNIQIQTPDNKGNEEKETPRIQTRSCTGSLTLSKSMLEGKGTQDDKRGSTNIKKLTQPTIFSTMVPLPVKPPRIKRKDRTSPGDEKDKGEVSPKRKGARGDSGSPERDQDEEEDFLTTQNSNGSTVNRMIEWEAEKSALKEDILKEVMKMQKGLTKRISTLEETNKKLQGRINELEKREAKDSGKRITALENILEKREDVKLHKSLINMEKHIDNTDNRLKNLEDSDVRHDPNNNEMLWDKVRDLERTIGTKGLSIAEKRLNNHEEWINDLHQRSIDSVDYSMGYNLLWLGLSEEAGSTFGELKKWYEWMLEQIGLPIDTPLDTIHRIQGRRGFPKPVLIKFCSKADRNWALQNEYKLRHYDQSYRLKEHFSKETEARRRILLPIYHHAKDFQWKPSLKKDKLTIDEREYNVNNLDRLPESFNRELVGGKLIGEHLAFLSKASVFSNFFQRNVKIGDKWFPCNEHYIQGEKALLCEDYDSYDEIQRTESPERVKFLGSQIKGFTSEKEREWDSMIEDISYRCNYAKFHEDPYMKNLLIRTGDLTLVEASKDDRWGCGFYMHDKDFESKMKNGKFWNYQGKSLMRIRSEIISELNNTVVNAIEQGN